MKNDILSMKMVLIYEKIYFKKFEKYLETKVESQGQSIDFDQNLTFCKIREEKGEKILQKFYFQNLERKRRI